MSSYPLILNKVLRTAWLVLPSVLESIREMLGSELGQSSMPEAHAGMATASQISEAKIDARMPLQQASWWTGRMEDVEYFHTLERAPGVAWISALGGIIGKRLTTMELDCGAASLDFFMQAMQLAHDDDEIHTILVDVNSPGGVSTGVPEAGRFIRRIAEGKRVVGFTDTKAYSAGQWLLAQCPLVIATPSAGLGSIGAYAGWWDDTKMREDRGEKLELFEAGKHKAAGLRPFTDQEREMLQAEIDEMHIEFKAAILSARPGVPLEAMEGQTFSGTEALELGLVDALVDTFDEALELIAV